jgi:hypothetical protein
MWQRIKAYKQVHLRPSLNAELEKYNGESKGGLIDTSHHLTRPIQTFPCLVPTPIDLPDAVEQFGLYFGGSHNRF